MEVAGKQDTINRKRRKGKEKKECEESSSQKNEEEEDKQVHSEQSLISEQEKTLPENWYRLNYYTPASIELRFELH